MKREFSQRIKILILPSATQSFKEVSSFSDIVFEQEVKSTSQGILYEQSLSVVVDKNESSLFMHHLPQFIAIVQLDDGTDTYTWGSESLPVKVTVLPKIEKCVLEMSRDAPMPLI